MSTILGVECAGGAVLAADRTVVRGGSVASTNKERTFDLGACGAVALGDDVDAFGRELENEVRSYATDRGEEMGLTPFASVTADLAETHGVDAIVAARDDDGVARIRAVDASGGVTRDPVAARGSGAAFVLGQLEGLDRADLSLDETVTEVEGLFAAVAERDVETGEEIDVYALDSDADADA